MDRKGHTTHSSARPSNSKTLKVLGGAWLAVAVLLTLTTIKSRAWAEAGQTTRESPGFFSRIALTYTSAFHSFQSKLDELKRADEENSRLRQENAHLRLVVESRRFECYAERSERMTREFERKLSEETLSRTGRTLASIDYQIPADLPPKELYALGVSYFRARDDEKAAVILTFLTGMEEDSSYRTAPNLAMTAIAWYRLEHFEKAGLYFDEALKAARGKGGSEELIRQSLIWKGLIAERTGKHKESQKWLSEVLDLSPRSEEAQLINHRGGAAPREVTQSTIPGDSREPAGERE